MASTLKESAHGGDIYAQKNKDKILDFSINTSPLGFPESIKSAIINSIDSFDRYPDINCRELKDALANFYSLPKEHFFIGNGAGEVIFSLCHGARFKNALVVSPSFSEYIKALRANECHIKSHVLRENDGFALTSSILREITPDIDAVFICNPNNPTGMLTDKSLLINILDKCMDVGAFLILDECFLDFTNNEESLSLLSLTKNYSNLFIIKAFTKIYSVAGLRLGFGVCSNLHLLKNMEFVTPPWNVSSVAQLAGAVALEDKEYKQKAISLIQREKPLLENALRELGFIVYNSSANFIFFKSKENCPNLKEELLKRDILIRSCSNYEGLEDSHRFFRACVRNNEDNKRLISALKEVIES